MTVTETQDEAEACEAARDGLTEDSLLEELQDAA